MGEGLPFTLGRLDDRWNILQHRIDLELAPSEYVRRNMLVTTAGVESHGPLLCAIDAVGIDNVLFSIDYPYHVRGRTSAP